MSITPETLRLQAEIDRMMREVTDAQAKTLQTAWGQAWDALREDLVRAVAETLATTGRITLALLRRNRRLTRVVQQVIDRLELVVAASERATVAGLRGLVDTAIAAQQSILDSQLPPGFDLTQLARWSRVDQRQVDAMVLRATERIHSLNRPLVPTAVAAMKRELVRGVTVGSNPRVTARRIVARAGEAGFGGGLTRAMTIARTETLDAYREAGRIAQEPHSDVLDGWTWLASLTPRTCPACLSMHGREFEQSVPGPQGHQNCRCSRLPRLKSWAELGIEGMDDEPDDEVPDADAYFTGLTPAQKQAMLGKRGYQAWLAGDWDRDQWAVKRKSAGWRDSWVNAKPPAAAGGGGDAGKPPHGVPSSPAEEPDPHRGFGPPPDARDKDAAREYWQRRAAVLEGPDFTGSALLRDPQEVRFVERMVLDRGEQLDWIPVDRRRIKTNDFTWRRLGIEAELKTNKPRYRTIAAAIRSDVPPKENFILDLEDRPLTDELTWQLEKYNQRNPEHLIRRLWVLSDNGDTLTVINLRDDE